MQLLQQLHCLLYVHISQQPRCKQKLINESDDVQIRTAEAQTTSEIAPKSKHTNAPLLNRNTQTYTDYKRWQL